MLWWAAGWAAGWAQNATAISRVAEAAGVTIGAGSVDLRPVAAFLIVMFLQVSFALLLALSHARSLSFILCFSHSFFLAVSPCLRLCLYVYICISYDIYIYV